MMHSYIGYTCLAFLPCVSSDVLACVSSNACLNQQHGKKHNYSYHIGFASLPCGFQYVSSMNKRRRAESHTGNQWLHLYNFSPEWVFKCVFDWPA